VGTPWNLRRLREHAKANSDAKILELLSALVRSDAIFRYHASIAKQALEEFFNHQEAQSEQNFLLIFGASERQEEFVRGRIASEANLIGCINSTHNFLETFAQLVNRTALENRIPIHDCSPSQVATILPLCELKTQLLQLLESPWHRYIQAFSNVSKHRQLIDHQVSISFIANEVGAKVGAFDYRGVTYPSYWANDVLKGVIEVKDRGIELGNCLNRHVEIQNS